MDSEQLSPEEFDAHIQNGTFRLAFVGMSNAGKSYRSKVLHKELGFLWYHVDEEIAKALGKNTDGLAAWMGYPTSEGYSEREREYMDLENKFTLSVSMQTNGKNLVFDTTGSVVHLPRATLLSLRENCLVVHVDVGEASLDAMVEKFFANPKPVAWGGHLTIRTGENEEEALRRSYPVLLQGRLKAYRALAHVNVPALELREQSADETLRIIRDKLLA